MKHHTSTVVFNASKNKVFDFISDINNLTTWATGFAREYRFENGKHKVLTPGGEIYFRMESNHESGVIDMWGGPTEEEMAYYPSRVLSLGDGQSAYVVTNFQWPGVPDEVFESQCATLPEEFDNIRANVE